LRSILLITLLAAIGCGSMQSEKPAQLRGKLVLETVPNPLIAKSLGGDEYEVAFDIVMREEGGVATRIETFTVEAIALGGIVVRSETHPATFITQRGYPAEVPSGQYLRFSFVKRWKLPTELLLSGAAVRVTARTIDANGLRNVTSFRADVNPSSTTPRAVNQSSAS